VPQDQDAVRQSAPVTDRWQIVAQEVEQEDRLTVQRSWLFGRSTQRAALVLNFAHGNAALDTSLIPGFSFEGELCFYPGHDVRAIVKSRGDLARIESVAGFGSLEAACARYGELLCLHPWLGEVVLPLQGIVPMRSERRWRLVDQRQQSLPARMQDDNGWRVTALSGGHPVDVVAAFDGNVLRPMAAATRDEYVLLTGNTSAGSSEVMSA
jgi:hypothetical protein